METIGDFIADFYFIVVLIIFLVVSFLLQKKATSDQAKMYSEFLKDSLEVLQESTKQTKRIADALEKRNDGK